MEKRTRAVVLHRFSSSPLAKKTLSFSSFAATTWMETVNVNLSSCFLFSLSGEASSESAVP